VSLAWLHPVELYDVTITDADGRQAIAVGKVTTSKTLLQLALDRSDLGTLTVEKPRVEVVVKAGTTNLEKVFAKYIDDTTPPAPHRTPIRVEVTDGTVILTDADRNDTRQLDGLTASVAMPKDRAEPITVVASAKSAGGGTISADCSVGADLTAKLVAAGFDLASVGPAVRRFEPGTAVGGVLTSDLTVERKASRLAADGKASVTDLSLAAGWLGPDVLKLKSADLPLKLALADGKLAVDHAALTCDAGTASFHGTVDTARLDQLLDQTGLTLDADVDVARLATLLPGLLRVKPGTELTGGRLTAKVASTAGPVGPKWAGKVSTTRLEGRRDGQPLTWDNPLTVTFDARVRPDGLPAFDDLVVVIPDVIGARARGEPESFVAAANVDLTRLTQKLEPFFDLDGMKLSGFARNVVVRTEKKAGGGYTLTADGTVTDLAVLDKTGAGIREPSLTLSVKADGDIRKSAGVRIETGTVKVTAGGDSLDVTLLDAITDVKALSSGRANVALIGDLAKWRARVGSLVGFPKGWELGGVAKQATAVVSLGEVVTAKNVKLGVTDAVFVGAGLDVREKELKLETEPDGAITYDLKSGALVFTSATVASATVSGITKRFEVKPNAAGEFGASGEANVVARLENVQRMLKLQSDPTFADQLRGVAEGRVSLTAPTFNQLGFVADLKVTQFAYGLPNSPTWSEPWVTVKADGDYDLTADKLTLRSAHVARDGFAATGAGAVGKLTTEVDLNVSGDLTYDLAKIEPQLKKYLGQSAAAVGKDTKPYHLSGNLMNGGQNLTVAVGGKPAGRTDLSRLAGNAAVGWQSLRAYGFDVGQSELKATVDKGVVSANPVEASFGGGKVRVEPTLTLNPGAYDLTFKKGKIIDTARLTPAVCAEALGYALPAIANTAQADGTISFDLDDNRIPLVDPTKGTVKGRLTIHDAAVSPGPVVSQLIEAIGMDRPKLQLSKGNVVPVRLENGRVHHADFRLNIGNTPVTTAGSVGVDGTLDLLVTVPVGGTIAEKILPNRPILQKAIAGQSITVAIGGTLTKPALNRDAMRGQMAKLAEGAMKDAAKTAGTGIVEDVLKKGNVDDALKKGLGELFKPKK
jgi:hypothetical protein